MWNDPRLRFPEGCPQRSEFPFKKYHIGSRNIEENLWFPLLDLGGVIQMQNRQAFGQ
jgi:hypothetical protein